MLIAAFPKMALLMQTLQDNRMLDKSNAATEAIRNDFRRLGLDWDGTLTQDSPEATAAHAVRMKHIYHLNEWRNHCAHHNILPPKVGGEFNIVRVQTWLASCDWFAVALDEVMRNHLNSLVGESPW